MQEEEEINNGNIILNNQHPIEAEPELEADQNSEVLKIAAPVEDAKLNNLESEENPVIAENHSEKVENLIDVHPNSAVPVEDATLNNLESSEENPVIVEDYSEKVENLSDVHPNSAVPVEDATFNNLESEENPVIVEDNSEKVENLSNLHSNSNGNVQLPEDCPEEQEVFPPPPVFQPIQQAQQAADDEDNSCFTIRRRTKKRGAQQNESNIAEEAPILQEEVWNDDDEIEESVKPTQQRTQYNLEQNLELEVRARFPEYFVGEEHKESELEEEEEEEEQEEEKEEELENDNDEQRQEHEEEINRPAQEDEVMPVMVSVRAEEPQNDSERVPVDIVCVIDHSGSMQGAKIELVRDTLTQLLELLQDNDRLSLIKFDDRAQRMTPLLRMTAENKERTNEQIELLNADGSTDITLGLRYALKVLRERKYRNSVTSIFLLTDGQDTNARYSCPLLLERDEQQDEEEENPNEEFSVNCFGFGSDHDAQLMDSIAEQRQGSFFFVERLESVDEAFVSALGALISVVAQDVRIEFSVTDPLEITKTFGPRWASVANGSYELRETQLIAGANRDYIAEVSVKKRDVQEEEEQSEKVEAFLRANLTLRDTNGNTFSREQEFALTINYGEQQAEEERNEDGEVMVHYYRVKAAEAMEEGLRLAEQGEFEEAQDVVQSMTARITGNRRLNEQRLRPIIQDLENVHSNFQRDEFEERGYAETVTIHRAHMTEVAQIMTNNAPSAVAAAADAAAVADDEEAGTYHTIRQTRMVATTRRRRLENQENEQSHELEEQEQLPQESVELSEIEEELDESRLAELTSEMQQQQSEEISENINLQPSQKEENL